MRPLISLQLYTVRDHLAKDELGTLETISSIGYEGVEIGYGSSDAFLNKCDELGLKITGIHVGLDALQNDLDGVVAFAKKVDNQFVILSWISDEHRGDLGAWNKTADLLSEIGAKLREQGLRLLYHNHDFEFESFDGKYGLDVLYENVPAENLGAELDTYWVKKGGADPVQYIERYSARLPLLHIKDITEEGDFAEIGQGTLNWPAIFAAAEMAEVSVYVVEQDKCVGDPFDSIKLSLENLKKMGKI
ncbi:sugar phosphate isomerase/epimerase [bacterium]|nr:MAG: sugar phosphate isomerase/epimerase [bacterium]